MSRVPSSLGAATPLGSDPADPLARALERLAGGLDYKSGLEALLLELGEDDAEELMLLHKESRAAWLPLVAGDGGEALFVGDARSGTVPPIAFVGFRLTVVDTSVERLAFSRFRDAEYVPGRTRYVAAGTARRLPFADRSFDLVVQEEGLPGAGTGWGHDLAELERLTRGELVFTADNRLGYKRSTGRRGVYHVPSPLEYLLAALRPARGERSVWGYRSALNGDFARPRVFALYPHARDFSHVVALDSEGSRGEARPRLTVGPRERRNILKTTGKALGLFPVLTPSFAVIGARGGAAHARPRIERVLDALSERIGEERGELDVLVATRSNDALIHTAARGVAPDDDAERPGRWTLHVPLSPQKQRLVREHQRFLALVRGRFPAVRVPEPLFEGALEGLWLTCERRLEGFAGPNLTGERSTTARMLLEAARDMATLVVRDAVPCDEETFEAHVGRSFDLVHRFAAVDSTRRALERLRAEARERLLGRPLPLVLYHADLRGKHVQVRPDGSIVGYLDWGASLERFLPYVDVLHLVAHQRKQEEDCSSGRTWELVRERTGLREHERAALDAYAEAVGLDAEVRAAIEAIYPVLVAEMAERNWDYSRPRWVHRQFGL